MNEDFDDYAGSSAPRRDGNYTSHQGSASATANGNGHPRRKHFDFWTALEILAHRWHWPIVCGILAGGIFFTLAWFYVTPKFTATTDLLRYETPGTSEFLKTSPLTSQTFAELLTAPDLMRQVGTNVQPPMSQDEVSKRVKVEPQEESDVIKVSLSASTPEEAVQLANLYGQEATNYTSQLQARQAAQVAESYLKEQRNQMDKDISDLTQQFRGMPAAAEVSNKLASAQSNLNALGQNPALSAQNTFIMGKLIEQLQEAQLELGRLLAKYTEAHPKVQETEATIAAINKQLNQVTGTTNGAATTALIQANGSVIQPELEVIRARLRALEDEHVLLDGRLREAQLYASNPPGMVRMFAPAQLKSVKSAHRRVKIGAATLVGGGIGVAFGLLLVS